MPDAREAAYRQVARELERRIKTGHPGYLPGYVLPTAAELIREFGHGRPTITSALILLEEMGLVTRRQGYGATVRTERDREIIHVPAGSVVSARMPTFAEQDQWELEPGVPMLVVGEQAWPADRYEVRVGGE